MAEPLRVDATFLRSAYQEVLGLNLSSSTEFVLGMFPFFMLQSAGILVHMAFGYRPYGDPFFHSAFPHHDVTAVRGSLGSAPGRRIATHQGWISASLIREQQPSGLDPYIHVGRALCPFALPGAAVGLIAPLIGRAVHFSNELGQLLRVGDVRRIFSIPDDPAV